MKTLATLTLTLALTTAVATAAPVLTNYSFEAATASGDDPAGWAFSGGVDVVINSGSDGSDRLTFGWGNSTAFGGNISQSITTFTGQTYWVEWDARGSAASTAGNVFSINGAADGISSQNTGTLNGSYITTDFSFAATGSATTIRFTDTTTGSTTGRDTLMDRAWVNVVRNGSFENDASGFTAWTNSGNVLAQATGFTNTDGPTGLRFAGNGVPANGSIYQTFDTLVGGVYAIEVDLRYGTLGTGAGTQMDINVFNGSGLGGFQLLDATQAVTSTFTTYTFGFVATSTQSTLQFLNSTLNNDSDVLLDKVNVRLDAVNAIPAPAALPAGLAMLGVFAARRRRR